jgi:KUP system potassium uptake protein
MGVLSLVTWTLTILVSLEYAWLAMSLGSHGEGGTIILRSVLLPLLKKGRNITLVTILTYVGVSLLIGDGVITPAISILSAVEGILLIPGFGHIDRLALIGIAAVIALVLFLFQRRGTGKMAALFGPLMLVWFLSLAVSGLVSISSAPSVWKSINPYYAFNFLVHHGLAGFFVLSEVILCATGGEALYADMGHLGRKPIVRAWYIVFTALMLNYLGQGAFIMRAPGTSPHVLFRMVLAQSQVLYLPFLLLSIIATAIASQAMIAGMFSIVYQGINTGIMPRFKVNYTSKQIHSQIYISFVNWFLLFSVLFIMFLFRSSDRLASAYGLAVTGTMTLTGVMMTWIFIRRRDVFKACLSFFVTLVDLAFLVSNTDKIPYGGYWSLVIAAVPLSVILIYTAGQKRLYKSAQPLTLNAFLTQYVQAYRAKARIDGSALFFVRSTDEVPLYVAHTILHDGIMYETNVFVHVQPLDHPFGVRFIVPEDLAPGLKVCRIETGYMEVIHLEKMLRAAGISEKVIFYGLVEIKSRRAVWKVYSAIRRLTPSIAQFYDLPTNKLRGVMYSVEM